MGPLSGLKVVELAGIGPGPFCGMMLGDMGATVISVERGPTPQNPADPLQRNRHRLILDLKSPAGIAKLLRLIDHADVVFEGYRPGVAERLGIGPDVCLARNPKLVYGRMTGWGQSGPLAQRAGHDINYIALTGALHAVGQLGGKPVVPLNLIGDFGGGGMLLAFGILSALYEAQRSGKGQVVDAAMVDGAAALMAMFVGMRNYGLGDIDEVGGHLLAGGAHFYDTYETRDGKYIALGSNEPQFYALLLEKLGLNFEEYGPYGLGGKKFSPDTWPEQKEKFAAVFRTRTRDEWSALLEGVDVCFAPVLTLSEAPQHPHNVERQAFIELGGTMQHAPAPRFSRSNPATPVAAGDSNMATGELLSGWGIGADDVGEILG